MQVFGLLGGATGICGQSRRVFERCLGVAKWAALNDAWRRLRSTLCRELTIGQGRGPHKLIFGGTTGFRNPGPLQRYDDLLANPCGGGRPFSNLPSAAAVLRISLESVPCLNPAINARDGAASAVFAAKQRSAGLSEVFSGFWRFAAGVAAFLWFASLQTPSFAESSQLTFDPSLCAEDPGDFVYVALWQSVFRIPADQLFYILDHPPDELPRVPLPPKPDDPEGCPGHPIQAAVFDLALRLDAWPTNVGDPPLVEGKAWRFKLVASGPEQWGLQPAQEIIRERNCSHASDIEQDASGLTICRVPRSDKPDNKSVWGFSVYADPDVYAAPFDRLFTSSCLASINDRYHNCSVAYKFLSDVNISYRFRTIELTISQLLRYDHALRARLKASRVEGYDWPMTSDLLRAPPQPSGKEDQ